MDEPLASNDDLDEELVDAGEPATVNDPAMTLLVFGMVAVLLVVIAAILIANRRPPAGL